MEEEELDVASSHEAGDVVVEEFIDDFQVPEEQTTKKEETAVSNLHPGTVIYRLETECMGTRSHLTLRPLHLFYHIETAVQDELVQMANLLAEAGLAVATLL